jgi:polysaccharide export outer membrane protein
VKLQTARFFYKCAGFCLLLLGEFSLAVDFQGSDSETPLRLSQATQAESPGTANTTNVAYRIDTGDRVSITVYREADLSVNGVRVKADGTIAFPLLGHLRVAGLTSRELQNLVTTRLLDGYLKKPNITVSIDSYRLYFIKGEVGRPGGYSFVDGLTVAKAVALAGGYTARASESSISLVREVDPDNPIESVGVNVAIRPGDIITVGESFF